MTQLWAIAAATPVSGNERRMFSAEPVVSDGESLRVARSMHWSWENSAASSARDWREFEPLLMPALPVAEGDVVWLAGPAFASAWRLVSPALRVRAKIKPLRQMQETDALEIGSWPSRTESDFMVRVGQFWTIDSVWQTIASAGFEAIKDAVGEPWAWSETDLLAVETVSLGIDEGLDVPERLMLRGLVAYLLGDAARWSRVAREAAVRLRIPQDAFVHQVEREISRLSSTRAALRLEDSTVYNFSNSLDEESLLITTEKGLLL